MGAHAEISPSGMARIVTCPASVKASLKVDARGDDEWNLEGTAAHNVLELWCQLGVPPLDGIVYEYLETTFHLVLDLEAQGYTLYFERVVRYSDRIWGTADIVAIKGKRIKIIDLKYGYRIVEVKHNAQLMTYAMCAEKEFAIEFSEFELIISQPRIPHIDGTIRRVTVDADVVDWHRNTVEQTLIEVDSDNPEFHASKHCKFCPLEGNCKTYTNWIAKLATGEEFFL